MDISSFYNFVCSGIIVAVAMTFISVVLGLGLSIVAFCIFATVNRSVAIFPFDMNQLSDLTTVFVIGIALVVFAIIFRIPTKN